MRFLPKLLAVVALAQDKPIEAPGSVHTLVSEDPKGMKTVFWLNGPLEFLDEHDQVLETFDVFWFIDPSARQAPPFQGGEG